MFVKWILFVPIEIFDCSVHLFVVALLWCLTLLFVLQGYTPLHIAALHGHQHILDLLIGTYGNKNAFIKQIYIHNLILFADTNTFYNSGEHFNFDLVCAVN